jgi:hypothetical protein
MANTVTNTAAAKTVACDVLVVGSGAGGLATAVAAQARGLKVILAEKDKWVGGTTAVSGGFMWVPNNPISKADGIKDSVEDARTYLRHEAGNHFNAENVDAFLQEGPAAIDFFHSKTALQFEPASAFSDYHPDAPGGRSGGRSIKALPYRAQGLGKELNRLRPPLPELTFVGLMIGSGPELKHFFNVTRSLKSAVYVAGRLLSHARDLAMHRRGMLLTNGNALAARLFRSALDLGVDVWTNAPGRAPGPRKRCRHRRRGENRRWRGHRDRAPRRGARRWRLPTGHETPPQHVSTRSRQHRPPFAGAKNQHW